MDAVRDAWRRYLEAREGWMKLNARYRPINQAVVEEALDAFFLAIEAKARRLRPQVFR